MAADVITTVASEAVGDRTDEVAEELPRDTLLEEFHASLSIHHAPHSNSSVKTAATPGFMECQCAAATKKGHYNEMGCGAHKLTLRNSKLYPDALGASQKMTSPLPLTPLTKSMVTLPSSKHAAVNTSSDALDSVLLRASKSTSSLRQQHNFTTEPSISLLPSLYSKTTPRLGGEYNESDSRSVRKTGLAFSPASMSIDPPRKLPLQEAQRMLELYTKIIRVNTETQKNMSIMYTRRSTLLAAMGKFKAALQDAEMVVQLEPKSTVVCEQFNSCWGYYRKGYALCGLGRFAEASRVFQQGLAFDVSCRYLRHGFQLSLNNSRYNHEGSV